MIAYAFVLVGCNQGGNKSLEVKAERPDTVAQSNLVDTIQKSKDIGVVFDVRVPLATNSDTISFMQARIKYRDSINGKLRELKKTEFDSSEHTAEGGVIYTFSHRGDTVKVTGVFYGETGQSQYDFYLKNNKIVAVNESLKFYDRPIGGEKVEIKIKRVENGFYILNGRAILTTQNDKNIDYQQKLTDLASLYNSVLVDIRNGQ